MFSISSIRYSLLRPKLLWLQLISKIRDKTLGLLSHDVRGPRPGGLGSSGGRRHFRICVVDVRPVVQRRVDGKRRQRGQPLPAEANLRFHSRTRSGRRGGNYSTTLDTLGLDQSSLLSGPIHNPMNG